MTHIDQVQPMAAPREDKMPASQAHIVSLTTKLVDDMKADGDTCMGFRVSAGHDVDDTHSVQESV